MSVRDRVDRIVELLLEAELDETKWPAASALIDDLCGLQGSDLLLARLTPQHGMDIRLRWLFLRGEPRFDLQHEYVEHYAAIDERPVAAAREPFGRLIHTNSLLTDRVRRMSPTYNQYLIPNAGENCLNVRMPVDGDLQMAWSLVGPGGGQPRDWTSGQVDTIRQLLPHVRHFVRVRHALTQAHADGMAMVALLDTRRIGVLLLNREGRIVEANDRARAQLAHGEGLMVRDGRLVGATPTETDRVTRLLAAAYRGQAGSLPIVRPSLGPLVLHATPRRRPGEASSGVPRRLANGVVQILLAEPFATAPIDAARLASALGLTPGQSVVAAALAAGATVASIAAASHRTEAAVRWHVRQALERLGLSRQADLVRVVLSTPGVFGDDAERP